MSHEANQPPEPPAEFSENVFELDEQRRRATEAADLLSRKPDDISGKSRHPGYDVFIAIKEAKAAREQAEAIEPVTAKIIQLFPRDQPQE
jgi:hypothetical protein